MPPRGSHPTGRRSRSVTPDRRTDACSIGERTVVDEVDACRASPPLARTDTTIDGVSAQSCALRLCEREDAILTTQILFEHSRLTVHDKQTVPLQAICVRFVALSAPFRTQIAGLTALDATGAELVLQ
jgi:hypothetical protein